MRPSGLEIPRLLAAGTQSGQFLQGGGDEGAGLGRGRRAVEVRVDVRGGHVDDGAERVGVLLQDVHRLGRGDGAGVAGGGEGGFGGGDEGGEGGGGAVAVEDGFVADDDHLHVAVVAVGPLGDGGDLLGGDADAGVGDVDAEDEF